MINIDWGMVVGIVWGINGGLVMAILKQYFRKKKLYRDGVLHTKNGTYVTTNSDGGYTFTPKPKGSKRV